MIIFDLDGCLADCEHRRHFVDPSKNDDYFLQKNSTAYDRKFDIKSYRNKTTGKEWKPDWKSFYEACDKDKPILPVFSFFNTIRQYDHVRIWSGRCESVRKKTIHWFMNRVPIRPHYWDEESWNHVLKMRPIGDSTPDDQLKEKWLQEHLNSPSDDSDYSEFGDNKINFVFDDRPKVIRMWRRHGIFVFNCCQHDEEF